MKRMGTVLLLVAVSCIAMGPLTMAEPIVKEELSARWEHYTLEFAAGTFAGFAGGVLSYWLVFSSQAHVSGMAPMAGWFSIPIGSLIGGSAGVIGTGWALGDKGNVLLTVLGAAVGAYVGFFRVAANSLLPPETALVALLVEALGEGPAMVISTGLATAVPAALGAVIGYNLGK